MSAAQLRAHIGGSGWEDDPPNVGSLLPVAAVCTDQQSRTCCRHWRALNVRFSQVRAPVVVLYALMGRPTCEAESLGPGEVDWRGAEESVC